MRSGWVDLTENSCFIVVVEGVGGSECPGLGVVSSHVAIVPQMGRNLPISADHRRCSSSSGKDALALQNSSFSCSKTFISRVRLEAAAMIGKAE